MHDSVDPRSASISVVDAENAADMARLITQARTLSKEFGLLPAAIDPASLSRILDIACARASAQEHRLSQIAFAVMDVRGPLAFSDASFDLVTLRFLVGVLSTSLWPRVLRECYRLLRPGGIVMSCEPESLGTTTSLALASANLLLTQAMRLAGKCFSPAGEQISITAVQHRLLAEAGYEQVQHEEFSITYSAGMLAHTAMVENFRTFLRLLQPFIVQTGLIAQDEMAALDARMGDEMDDGDFCATAFFQRVWGSKPVTEDAP